VNVQERQQWQQQHHQSELEHIKSSSVFLFQLRLVIFQQELLKLKDE